MTRDSFRPRRLLPHVAAISLFITLWQVWGADDQRRTFMFGSPGAVAAAFWGDLTKEGLAYDFCITLGEASAGWILGTVSGVLLGLVLSSHSAIGKFSAPYLAFLAAIPVFAIAPMTVVWFGTGFGAKVALAALASVFVAVFQTYWGARSADPDLLEFVEAMGGGRFAQLRYVILPSSLTWAIASFRLSSGMALVGAFVGEFISSQAGIGHYILAASSLYDVPRVLVGVVLLGMMALFMSYVATTIENFLVPWRARSGIAS